MNNKDFDSRPYRMTNPDDSQRPEDDFFDKDAAYEAWEEQSGSVGGELRRFWLLLAILIVALIGIYIIYQAISPRQNTVRLSQFRVIDSRIDELELRLNRVEENTAKMDMAPQSNDQTEILESLSGRIGRLENSFKTWVEEAAATKEMVKEKKSVAAKPKKAPVPVAKKEVVTEKKKPSTPVKKQPAKKQPVAAKSLTKPAPSSSSGDVRYHTVQPEENLYRISLKYNLSIDKIKELNNLTGDTIRNGQKLRISP